MVEDISLDKILHPISPEEFFDTYLDKQALHIPGPPEKFEELMNWQTLNEILNMSSIWGPQSLSLVLDRNPIPPTRYCLEGLDREERAGLRPDPGRVMALIRKGASLIANDIDELTGPLRSVKSTLETSLEGRAQANLYYSGKQRQAFESHYDTHDVFAFHFEGEKSWRLFETRVDNPIRHPRFLGVTNEQHAKQRGAPKQEVVLRPGDLLYIPRGTYHDARAISQASLHIAFGVTSFNGIDLLDALREALIPESVFRSDLPRSRDGKMALRTHVEMLADRLNAHLRSDEFLDAFRDYREKHRGERPKFELPIAPEVLRYQLMRSDYKLRRTNELLFLTSARGRVQVPPAFERPLTWVLQREAFDRDELLEAFPETLIQEIDKFIGDLSSMGVISRVCTTKG